MTNEMKLLRAFIEASGFDVETVRRSKGRPYGSYAGSPAGMDVIKCEDGLWRDCTTEYTVTKRDFKNKPTLHKIIRQYEKEGMTASEMIGRIMLIEGVSNEDL